MAMTIDVINVGHVQRRILAAFRPASTARSRLTAALGNTSDVVQFAFPAIAAPIADATP